MLTKPVLNDRDGALQRLDGLAVLRVQAIGHTELVVSLCQQAAVWVQVLHLQLQALLEILQCLWIVPWKREAANQHLTCKKKQTNSAFSEFHPLFRVSRHGHCNELRTVQTSSAKDLIFKWWCDRKKTCSVTTGCGCEHPLRKLAFQKVEAETFYGSTNLGCPQVGKQHNGRFNFSCVTTKC